MTKNAIQPNVSDALFRVSRGLSWCFSAEHNRANPWFLTDMLGDGALTLSFQGALEPSYNTDNVWNRGQFSSTEDAAYEAPNASGNWIPYTQELNGSPAAISSVFVGTMGPGGQSQRELFNVNTNSTSHRFLYSSYNAGGTNSYTINARRRTTGVGSSPDTFQDHEVVVFFRYLEQGGQLLLDIYCPRLDRWTVNSGSPGDPFSPINNVIVKEGPAVESIGFWATSFDHWDQRAIEEIAHNPFGLLDALNQPPAVIDEAPPGPVDLAATLDIAYGIAADLTEIVDLSANLGVDWELSGGLFVPKELSATLDVEHELTPWLTIEQDLSGDVALQYDLTGTLESESGLAELDAQLDADYSLTGVLVVDETLIASPSFQYDLAGTITLLDELAGQTDLIYDLGGTLSKVGPIDLAAQIDWALSLTGQLSGGTPQVVRATGLHFATQDGPPDCSTQDQDQPMDYSTRN